MNYLKKWLKRKFDVEMGKNEKEILQVRKYWITLLGPGIKVFFAIFIPGIFLDFIFNHVSLLVLFLAWFAFVLGYALYHSVRWYYDSFIITNKRIIDIDQKGVFNRTVSETTFERVQDATYEVKGFLGTMLNYGMVKVQTAGAEETIELTHVHHPKKVQDQILKIGEGFDEDQEEGNKNEGEELSAKELIKFIQSTKEKSKNQNSKVKKES
ncbi:PH domain-containing protein [Patescibacteria group bacterium]